MKKTVILTCLLSLSLLSSALVAAPRDKCGCGAGGGVPRPTAQPRPTTPPQTTAKPAPVRPQAQPATVAKPAARPSETTRAPRPPRSTEHEGKTARR